MRPKLRLLVLVAAGLPLAACRPPATAAGAGAPPQHTAYRGPLVSSLQVETMADSARLTLKVTNPTEGPVTLTFSSGQRYDFAVLRGAATVWRWSADHSFLQAIQTETLPAGETRSFSETFRLPPELRGATLTAAAWLTSSDHAMEHRTQFRIP